MSGWAIAAAIGFFLTGPVSLAAGALTRRVRRGDRVDAAWRDTRAGVDLEQTAGHERLNLDPVQRRRAIDACEEILVSGNEKGAGQWAS